MWTLVRRYVFSTLSPGWLSILWILKLRTNSRALAGYSYALAQLLSSPPYVFATIMSLATAWLSDKLKIRWPIICAQCAVAVVGLIIMLYGKVPAFRYFGLFLAVYGSQANGPQFLAYGQNQTATLNKKGIVAAVMISVGAAGGVTGSTIFRAQDAPVRKYCLELSCRWLKKVFRPISRGCGPPSRYRLRLV